MRETRRFKGEYVLSDEDVETGARFPDVVVHRAWFLIDIHNPKGGGQAEGHSKPAVPYDIPLRSLIPKNLDGVFLAGRNISGTHRAHGSYRVMGIALATGQAAGIAAAVCAMDGLGARELDYRRVQKVLMDYGAEPVSYTHLDVYKRQILDRRHVDNQLISDGSPDQQYNDGISAQGGIRQPF